MSPDHHRRSSSFKETLNAFAQENLDGVRTVNQYIFSNTILGTGSFATVEMAVDRETGIHYAVKEFSKSFLRKRAMERLRTTGAMGVRTRQSVMRVRELSADEQGLANLDLISKEVEIMKAINHPNIAQVHELIDISSEGEEDSLMLVMELCRGGPIAVVTSEQNVGMDETRARSIFRQVICGLAYLHHHSIVHRDIKPENILLLDDGKTVKIVDFGVSELIKTRSDIVHKSTGSPAFFSPELCSCTSSAEVHGFACDLWACGVTLYYLCVGRHPFSFQSNDVIELFRSIQEDAVTFPPTLSPNLCHLFSRLLDKDPSTRCTIEELWTDAWMTQESPMPDYNTTVAQVERIPSASDHLPSHHSSLKTSFIVASAVNKFKSHRGSSRSREVPLTQEPISVVVEGVAELGFTASPPASPNMRASEATRAESRQDTISPVGSLTRTLSVPLVSEPESIEPGIISREEG